MARMKKIKPFYAWAVTGPVEGKVGHKWRFDGSKVDWKNPAELTIYRTRKQAKVHGRPMGRILRVRVIAVQ